MSSKLHAVSPIDGKYASKTKELSKYFSEAALIKHRVKVEVEYLIALSEHNDVKLREFNSDEKSFLRNLEIDLQIVKDIEVKGYDEYYLKLKLNHTSLNNSLQWIHFGLTSEDVNNIAYALMLSNAKEQVMIPKLNEMYNVIEGLAQKYKGIPMLARTHGQPASPTTFGKEFKNYSARLKRQLDQLKQYKVLAKLNGATGNYNAHYSAYPNVDWVKFSKDFISKLNLEPNLITTQIEPHDSYAELFDIMRRINNIFHNFVTDMWRYVSDGWVKQKTVEGEIGSSTMPHKVNPIDFENAEGNFGVANSLFIHFSEKLTKSRLQRDLSDSTVLRNLGVAFGHSLIGYKSVLKGLSKIDVNEKKVISELKKHPEVIAEAIQTVLRRENSEMPYERLKELTQGKKVSLEDLRLFIDGLNVSLDVKNELKLLTPENYIGIADKLVNLN